MIIRHIVKGRDETLDAKTINATLTNWGPSAKSERFHESGQIVSAGPWRWKPKALTRKR